MQPINQIQIANPEEVFNEVYLQELWDNYKRLRIVFGGSSSGKSKYLADEKVLKTFENRNTLIVRKVRVTIRGSVWKELEDSINRLGLSQYFVTNNSFFEITNKLTGHQIACIGLDDVEKVKSIRPSKGVWDDIWVEEATELTLEDYLGLRLRQRGKSNQPKRFDMSFNPIIATHWIVATIFDSIGWADDQIKAESDKIFILRTTYIDNKFLEDEEKEYFEELKLASPYHYQVYALGHWGVLGDLIYTKWEVKEFDADNFDKYNYGLDWGFSSDPFAFVKTHYDRKNKTIYICDEIYQRGLSNEASGALVKEKMDDGIVICDSAEPKSIDDYVNMGIHAIGAKKGKGSVEHGVKKLQAFKIVIHPRCINFKNEIQIYQWKKDKDGNSLPRPVDKKDHLLDALRYCYEDDLMELSVSTVRIGKRMSILSEV